MISASGGILLLFKWADGLQLHVQLYELSQPRVIELLKLISRQRGAPTLHEPEIPSGRRPVLGVSDAIYEADVQFGRALHDSKEPN